MFQFNENDIIQFAKEYNLDNKNKIKFIEDNTENQIIKTGLLEKIFGGVGAATTPIN